MDTIELDFSEVVPQPADKPVEKDPKLERYVVRIPKIEASTEKIRESVEKSLDEGTSFKYKGMEVKLPPEVVEGAKAAFMASGGNISYVADMYDITSEAVLRLASDNDWPVYGGGVLPEKSQSRGQLTSLRDKLWTRIEKIVDAMDVETKAKNHIMQHRIGSKYIEPLSARSGAFKNLMDQYMRVATILEPEIFAGDPDPSNSQAKRLQEANYPGGIEGVNREIADFFSQVVVGIADRIADDRELKGYGKIIDMRET